MNRKIIYTLILILTITFFNKANAIDKNRHSINISTSQINSANKSIFKFPNKFKLNQIGLGYEYYLNNSFSLEMGANLYLNDSTGNINFKNYNLNILLNYNTNNGYIFSTNAIITPFVAGGITQQKNDNTLWKNNIASTLIRAGVNLQLGNSISTQLYLQNNIPFYDFVSKTKLNSSPEWFYTIGATVKFQFGKNDRKFKAPIFYTANFFDSKKDITTETILTDLPNEKIVKDSNLLINLADTNISKVTTSIIKKDTIVKKANKDVRKIKITQKKGSLNLFVSQGEDIEIELDNTNLYKNSCKKHIQNRSKILSDTTTNDSIISKPLTKILFTSTKNSTDSTHTIHLDSTNYSSVKIKSDTIINRQNLSKNNKQSVTADLLEPIDTISNFNLSPATSKTIDLLEPNDTLNRSTNIQNENIQPINKQENEQITNINSEPKDTIWINEQPIIENNKNQIISGQKEVSHARGNHENSSYKTQSNRAVEKNSLEQDLTTKINNNHSLDDNIIINDFSVPNRNYIQTESSNDYNKVKSSLHLDKEIPKSSVSSQPVIIPLGISKKSNSSTKSTNAKKDYSINDTINRQNRDSIKHNKLQKTDSTSIISNNDKTDSIVLESNAKIPSNSVIKDSSETDKVEIKSSNKSESSEIESNNKSVIIKIKKEEPTKSSNNIIDKSFDSENTAKHLDSVHRSKSLTDNIQKKKMISNKIAKAIIAH